jgi:hypothetical protein
MSTKSAIALAQLLGVTLSVRDGKIVAKPSSAVTGLLRQEVKAHKDELLIILGAAHETAHTDTAARSGRQGACVGEGRGRDTRAGAQQASRGQSLARGIEAPQVGVAASSTGSAGGEQQVVSDVKRQALEERLAIMEYDGRLSREETERRAVDKPQFAARAFLYSVVRDGGVERAILVSQDIRTEPLALEHLRQRFPWLKIQWERLITHPVCSGCQHYTGGVLCNADRSPEHVVKVGRCGRYEATRPVSEARS